MAGDSGEPQRDAPSLGLSPLSRVRIDALLREMLDRVGEVVASRERLRALLDAVVGIGGDLDLRTVLQRIVAAACELADARYAALGIVGADRELSDFITHGIDPELHAAIGELPHGRHDGRRSRACAAVHEHGAVGARLHRNVAAVSRDHEDVPLDVHHVEAVVRS